ncbi:DUF2029 domain-containing protein [Ralstonia solanacearum]|uniref:glycosyltransferase family 87 protein n=1 Tax=Ralstonia solanacearum TaxID=305 RepID=UPI0005C6C6FA|nr:glycosyltransferase family 87 protein [Ralstonia solanacearum]MBB6591900.1 DUF2029 domain-containing protein [Ralstonia solanacearum]MBB6596123.1 DUF2029 domain-containing protein [Ralstonia solanacearum]MDB0543213.1 DUF2029 domain-containing protein [Ralstonia solanacearum]MDB0552920.1 DUF2029 domain-containing protein [Ralstonia solanacearum]MDB0558193.1 DUF2029 domain-containing protein [Ralstonia solanacearum]
MSRQTTDLATQRETASQPGADRHWINASTVRKGSMVMLCLSILIFALGAWVTDGFTDTRITGPASDFSVFWGASHIALHDSPLQAYDLDRMMRVIGQYGTLELGTGRLLPWLYPPTFLLLVLPLSLLPLWPSYLLFMLATGAFYVKATLALLAGRVAPGQRAWTTVLGSPAVFVTVLMGQNAMLTAGLAATAVACLGKRPVLAGVAIGLLAIKPQLAILFPVALIVARAWKTLASAALTATLFAGVSIAVCGWDTVPAFLNNARWAETYLVEDGGIAWYVMPTFLAAARTAGVGVAGAYAVQVTVALLAVCALIYGWLRTTDTGLRTAMLATATLLISPYVRTYELTWLVIAIAGYVSHGIRFGLSGTERVLLVVAWLLPVFEFTNPLFKLPQVGPFVTVAVVLMILRRVAGQARAAATASGQAPVPGHRLQHEAGAHVSG